MHILRKAARKYGDHGLAGITIALKHRHMPRIPAVQSNEYLGWLQFAVPGMLERGNVDCFDWAIRHLPSDAPIVEIGSFCGLSTNVMTYLKRHHGKTNRLITCDRWIFERRDKTAELDDSGVSFDDYREFVRETFLRNAHMFSRHDLPFTVELFSDEFFEAWTARDTMNDVFGRSIALGWLWRRHCRAASSARRSVRPWSGPSAGGRSAGALLQLAQPPAGVGLGGLGQVLR